MNKNYSCQESYEEIGFRLAKVRGKVSQQKFGEMIGISRMQVSTMELGKVTVPVEVCVAVNKKFGISLTWLLLGEGQPTYTPGDNLTNDEQELVDLTRRTPQALSLIKRVIAGQEAIGELAEMSQKSGTSVRSQHQGVVNTTRRLLSGREHLAVAA